MSQLTFDFDVGITDEPASSTYEKSILPEATNMFNSEYLNVHSYILLMYKNLKLVSNILHALCNKRHTIQHRPICWPATMPVLHTEGHTSYNKTKYLTCIFIKIIIMV